MLRQDKEKKKTGDYSWLVAMLRSMAARNDADGEAAAKPIEFRIGVNLGDIVVEDGDIFGDGVNVAARLEGLALLAAC